MVTLADVVLGIENVASIWVAVSHVTDVATIVAEPVCVNLTVGVETKPAPVNDRGKCIPTVR